jgi:hypothetical protein
MSLSFTKSGMIGKANIGEELLYFFSNFSVAS